MAVHLVRNCDSFSRGEKRIRKRQDLPGKTETSRRIRKTGKGKETHDTTRIIRVIQEEIAGLRSEVESDREVQNSLEEAQKMQRQMLPEIPEMAGYRFATLYKPCQKVGGDFYDFISLPGGKMGVAIGDVSGHGMEAALVMGMAKKALQIHARQHAGPVEILSAANEEVRGDLHANSFLTVTLGILDPGSKTFHFARAGHTPLILINPERKETIQVLQPNGTALGMIRSDRFTRMLESATVRLQKGDLLIQFTDGVTEAMNTRDEEFGMDRLIEVLKQVPDREVDYISYKVDTALRMFQGKKEQQDDIAILALRFLG